MTKKLIVMIQSSDEFDRAGSSTVATSWEAVTNFAKDEVINFIPFENGEMLCKKLNGSW